MKRYVLDGPPGAGKTTVMFGVADGDASEKSPHTLQGRGFQCIHESVAEAHDMLREKGMDFSSHKDAWLEIIAKLDRTKFDLVTHGMTFFDRCYHHWKLLSESSGISLPSWYDEWDALIRYDTPVFILAPIASIDLDSPGIHESRRFSWEQRLEMFRHLISLYEKLKYDLVEVPVFHEGDVDLNNRARIEFILEHLA